jgi:hypothetical protein
MSKMFARKNKQEEQELEVPMQPNPINEDYEQVNKESSNLDINLVIASFQEKLTQVMTELIVKEATIKQLLAHIEKLKER